MNSFTVIVKYLYIFIKFYYDYLICLSICTDFIFYEATSMNIINMKGFKT